MNYKDIKENPRLTLEEIAYNLLQRSSESARNRCNRNEGKYKNVKCELTPTKLRDELWKDNKFRESWMKLTDKWIKNGYKERDRPTLDRRNSHGDYEVSNIQAKSHHDNVSRAKKVKCIVVSYTKNGELQCELSLGLSNTLSKYSLSRKQFPDENKDLIQGAYVIFIEEPLRF
jgi:hypothetical protein